MSDTKHDYLDEVCANCGLTLGAHCAFGENQDRCPAHEGKMDWREHPVTSHFEATGEFRVTEVGTPAKNLPREDA